MRIVDDHTVDLRATRSGSGYGRVYTVWLQATDAAGNLSQPFAVEVTVPLIWAETPVTLTVSFLIWPCRT